MLSAEWVAKAWMKSALFSWLAAPGTNRKGRGALEVVQTGCRLVRLQCQMLQFCRETAGICWKHILNVVQKRVEKKAGRWKWKEDTYQQHPGKCLLNRVRIQNQFLFWVHDIRVISWRSQWNVMGEKGWKPQFNPKTNTHAIFVLGSGLKWYCYRTQILHCTNGDFSHKVSVIEKSFIRKKIKYGNVLMFYMYKILVTLKHAYITT